MAKKHKKTNQQANQPAEKPLPELVIEPISGRGKKTMGIGVGTLAAGFIVLSFADPMGSNWAAHLSPFLILGGYFLVGIGIFLPGADSPKSAPCEALPPA